MAVSLSRVVHVICPRLFPWAGSHGFMTSAWAECHKTAGTRARRALPTSSLFSLFLWFLHPIPCLIPIYTLVLCLALDSGCILHNPTGLSRDLRPLLLYAQTAEVCPVILFTSYLCLLILHVDRFLFVPCRYNTDRSCFTRRRLRQIPFCPLQA